MRATEQRVRALWADAARAVLRERDVGRVRLSGPGLIARASLLLGLSLALFGFGLWIS